MIDFSLADSIQNHSVHLVCDLKKDHSFLLDSDYRMLMSFLYLLIDKIDDFV